MLIIWGFHRFARKLIGYRNDYCLNCNREQVSEWQKSFHMGHLYWIPLIPLGIRREWFCTVCGANPHARVATSKGFKRFVAGIFLLITIFFTTFAVIATANLNPDFAKPADAMGMWIAAAVAGLISTGAIWWATFTGGAPDLGALLQQVGPLSKTECRYCGGGLDGEGSCANCQITHYPLEFV
ncbi:MAG: hypothetical protein QM758_04680 [Armatimonas sp.]